MSYDPPSGVEPDARRSGSFEALRESGLYGFDSKDIRARPFTLLRAQILRITRQRGWKIIGITSPTFRFPVTGLQPATGMAETLQPGDLHVALASTPMNVTGRLAPHATPQAASAELLPIYRETALAGFTSSLRDRAEPK